MTVNFKKGNPLDGQKVHLHLCECIGYVGMLLATGPGRPTNGYEITDFSSC